MKNEINPTAGSSNQALALYAEYNKAFKSHCWKLKRLKQDLMQDQCLYLNPTAGSSNQFELQLYRKTQFFKSHCWKLKQ